MQQDQLGRAVFLINEEFTAKLDYHVVKSLSAKSSEAKSFRTYYS